MLTCAFSIGETRPNRGVSELASGHKTDRDCVGHATAERDMDGLQGRAKDDGKVSIVSGTLPRRALSGETTPKETVSGVNQSRSQARQRIRGVRSLLFSAGSK
ncbi:hypothetical protein BaRGS_00008458 [Batillaria attramentaria]|uniref:Uncharacterized protein n=1 Tax=Batillaria attramentaria TaxID=370345 RepID=A0ABD0LLN4_9CAEN